MVLGMSAAIGSIIPLIRIHPEKMFSNAGLGVLLGVVLVLVGVVVCAIAGRRREAAMGVAGANQGGTSQARGLMFAIGSGLGAAMVNLGLTFGFLPSHAEVGWVRIRCVLMLVAGNAGGSDPQSPVLSLSSAENSLICRHGSRLAAGVHHGCFLVWQHLFIRYR